MDFFSFNELLLVAFVALLVLGPERLPETLRTLGLWLGRLRRSFTSVKTELEKEIGMDEIRRQLHNEAVMEEMKRIEREVKDSVQGGVDQGMENSIDPNAGTNSAQADDLNEADAVAAANREAADDAGESADPDSVQATAAQESSADESSAPAAPSATPEPEAAPRLPRSEAELEALHARRQRMKESG